MRSQTVSLTEGSITKGLIWFSVPILLSNLFQQLYNSIDSAVVGSYAGDQALAAVGSTGSLINLLIGFFLGIATGTGILYAMHYGAQNYKGMKETMDSALILSLIAAVFLMVFGIIFAPAMLRMMDTPDDVIDLSITYLRVFLVGTIANLVYNVGAGIIRAAGDSTRPLIYLLISGVANLALDLLFVAVFDMGVAGAALATVLAQTISAVLVTVHLMRLPEEYRLKLTKLSVNKVAVWDVIRISVPCGLQGSMFNISNLLVQARINSFGSVAMAGVTAYSKIDGFIYMPMMALSLSASTYVGQNVGAGQYQRIPKGIRVCLAMCLGVSILLGGVVLLTCDQLLNLFTTDPASKSFALEMMWYMAPFAWTYSVADILGGAIRGGGQAVKVTIITAICICIFRVVWLSVLLPIWNDIQVVFLCYPVSWIFGSVVMAIYYFKGSSIRKTIKASKL